MPVKLKPSVVKIDRATKKKSIEHTYAKTQTKEELVKKEKKERKELPKDIKEVQITGVPKKAVPKRVMLFADAESDSGEN
mgnify:CR=1 FL=1